MPSEIRDALKHSTLLESQGGRGGGVSAGADMVLSGAVLGRSGNKILRYHVSAAAITEYSATALGLDEASTAASAGDTIYLPGFTISGDHTLTAGVHYRGLDRWATVLSGQITGADGATLGSLSITRAANDGNDLKGLVAPASGTLKVACCDITVTQSGAGAAYAVSVEGNGDVRLWFCDLSATSVGGTGLAGYSGAGTGKLYLHQTDRYGSTQEFNG